jgi:large subunit ribosomal protein L24
MSIAKIQTGDTVKVIAGNFKGSVGVVTKVQKKQYRNGIIKTRASVNGLPKIAKYRKAQTFQGQNYPGAKLEVDRFIDVSNLSLVDAKNKLSKVRIEISKDGKKLRVLKTTSKVVEKLTSSKKTKQLETKDIDK